MQFRSTISCRSQDKFEEKYRKMSVVYNLDDMQLSMDK